MTLSEKDSTYIWHPFTPYLSTIPLPIVRAEGVWLYTDKGEAILDAISSWWVNIHGHAHPYLAEAIYRQALQLEHVIFAGFTHAPAVSLAERLIEMLPSKQQKVFFSDNGSTAVEVALKMTMQYFYNNGTPRKRIIAIEGAYHGDTFGAMSVGDRSPFNAPFAPYLFDVSFIAFPTEENREAVISHFKELIYQQDTALFIFEPLVQGASGMRMYAPELLDTLIGIAQANGVICIADEVMTGFGRTGTLFAAEQLKNQPDIFCLSKGLTGGVMPLGITTCTNEIATAYQTDDFMKTFFHGHSFTANPLACAVANASLDLLLTPICQANRERIATQHRQFAEKITAYPHVQNVRTLGTIFAFEFKTAQFTSYFNEARGKLYDYFIQKNILLRPLGNVIYILPPYIITNQELQTVYEAIEKLLTSDEYTQN
jgi:adenosylmethionine-8-amino-7-oxononanoate aminotransferase